MSSRKPPNKRLRLMDKRKLREKKVALEKSSKKEIDKEISLLQKQIEKLEESKETLEQDLADSMSVCTELDEQMEQVHADAREFDKNGWRKLRETFTEKQVRQLRSKVLSAHGLRDAASRPERTMLGYSDDEKAIAWTIQNLMTNRRAYDYIRQYMNIPYPARARVGAWRARSTNKPRAKAKSKSIKSEVKQDTESDMEYNYQLTT